MSSLTDAADEAGGEAIYSSDGLPPITKPPAPKASQSGAGGVVGDDVLDTTTDLVQPTNASSLFSPSAKMSIFERISWLQAEVSELQTELKDREISQDHPISQLASDLVEKVAATSNQASITRDLNQLVQKHVVEKPSSNTAEDSEPSVVYELYGGKVADPNLEERLHKLEAAVGMTGSSLATRVDEMESRMARLDEKKVEEAVVKAKVIRSDLEAASKARAKLSGVGSAEDNKTIAHLYTQLQDLEGISEHLPALVKRLEQLASLHQQSAQTGSRLASSEGALRNLEQSLSSVSQSLSALESTMASNVSRLDGNLKAMEERVSTL